jgi:hypothetical protein
MSRKYCISISCCCFFFTLFILSAASYAAHPLITDDTGTQGKGNYQVEINAESGYDRETEDAEDTEDGVTVKETGLEAAGILSYGITDSIDIVFGVPYQWNKAWEDGDMTSDYDGISDMSLELKWRFYEAEGFGLALKPGVTLPTGKEEKGLGNGRISSGLTFITTKEIGPWAFHLNLAYTHNGYKLEEDRDANRKDIWHVSLASEVEVVRDLTAVANMGIEKNPDKTSHVDPAFVLGGFVYSITDDLDIDFGYKAGLNKPETDYSILAGTAYRF